MVFWNLILQGQQEGQQGTYNSSIDIKILFSQEVRINTQSEYSLSEIRPKILESHRDALARRRTPYGCAYHVPSSDFIFPLNFPENKRVSPNINTLSET